MAWSRSARRIGHATCSGRGRACEDAGAAECSGAVGCKGKSACRRGRTSRRIGYCNSTVCGRADSNRRWTTRNTCRGRMSSHWRNSEVQALSMTRLIIENHIPKSITGRTSVPRSILDPKSYVESSRHTIIMNSNTTLTTESGEVTVRARNAARKGRPRIEPITIIICRHAAGCCRVSKVPEEASSARSSANSAGTTCSVKLYRISATNSTGHRNTG